MLRLLTESSNYCLGATTLADVITSESKRKKKNPLPSNLIDYFLPFSATFAPQIWFIRFLICNSFFSFFEKRLQAGGRARAGRFTHFIFLPVLHCGGRKWWGEGHRQDVKVMDPFVLRLPGPAARYEGRSRGCCCYITPLELLAGVWKSSVEMVMLIYQDGLGCLH